VEAPTLIGELTSGLKSPARCSASSSAYAFITDDDGFKVVDVSDPPGRGWFPKPRFR